MDAAKGSARRIKKAGLSLRGRQALCARFSRAARQERLKVQYDAVSGAQKDDQILQINLAETSFYALAARQAFNVAADGGGWLKRRQAEKALKTFWNVAQRCEIEENIIHMIVDDMQHDPVPAQQNDPFTEKVKERLSGYINAAQDNVRAHKEQQLAQLPPPPGR